MRLDPSDGAAQANLATLLSEVGQVDDAVRVLREAAQREPGNPDYDLRQGIILTPIRPQRRSDQGFRGHAEALCATTMTSSRWFVPAFRWSTSIRETTPRARPSSSGCWSDFPMMPARNNDLGYLYAEQGKNLEKAEAMIRKALLEDKSNRAYLDSLGWVLFKRGKAKEALEPLDEGRRKNEGGCRGRKGPARTRRSSSIWATCISTSTTCERRLSPGARRRNSPNRLSRRNGACRRSGRKSGRWSSLVRYPSRRRPEHLE